MGHSEDQQRQWVHAKLDQISQGRVEDVLKELEIQNKTVPNGRLRRFIGYLSRFEDAVDTIGSKSLDTLSVQVRWRAHIDLFLKNA